MRSKTTGVRKRRMERKLAAEIHGWAPDDLRTPITPNATPSAGGRCCTPRRRWLCGAASTPLPTRCGRSSPNCSSTSRRVGASIAGADIPYPMPGANSHALAGTFAPDLTLRTHHGATSVAALCTPHAPYSSTSPTVRTSASSPGCPRAWAATDEPAATAAPGLRQALSHWFGNPAPACAMSIASRFGRYIMKAPTTARRP